jgi:hypothetical protein
MTKRTGAAAIGVTFLVVILSSVTLTLGGSASARATGPAAVAVQQARASDVSARRHQRPRYVSPPSRPYYYGRPSYYAPAPFFPIPPFFGYGWEPW